MDNLLRIAVIVVLLHDKIQIEKRNKKNRKLGGQKGQTGNCLKKIENPDQIEEIKIDRKMIPPGNYKSDGFEPRQVFDLEIKIHVTEYRAEVLVHEKNERFVAEFPKGVTLSLIHI